MRNRAAPILLLIIFFISLYPIIGGFLSGGGITGTDISNLSLEYFLFSGMFLLGSYLCVQLENPTYLILLFPSILLATFPINTLSSGDGGQAASLPTENRTRIDGIVLNYQALENLTATMNETYPNDFPGRSDNFRGDKTSHDTIDIIEDGEKRPMKATEGFCFINGTKGNWGENDEFFVALGTVENYGFRNVRVERVEGTASTEELVWVLYAKNGEFERGVPVYPKIYYSCIKYPIEIEARENP